MLWINADTFFTNTHILYPVVFLTSPAQFGASGSPSRGDLSLLHEPQHRCFCHMKKNLLIHQSIPLSTVQSGLDEPYSLMQARLISFALLLHPRRTAP